MVATTTAATTYADTGIRGDEPVRTCIVTGETHPVSAMMRFVVDPEGQMVPDIDAKLPGRGYWVIACRSTVDEAVRKRCFERAAARGQKGKGVGRVAVDPGLGQWVEDLLTKRCLEYLGLACRAGQVVTGFEKAREFLRGRPGVVVVEASDGSADGLRKLIQGMEPPQVLRRFSREQLSLALGRENVVHAAVEAKGIGARFVEMVERLMRYAPVVAAEPGSA